MEATGTKKPTADQYHDPHTKWRLFDEACTASTSFPRRHRLIVRKGRCCFLIRKSKSKVPKADFTTYVSWQSWKS